MSPDKRNRPKLNALDGLGQLHGDNLKHVAIREAKKHGKIVLADIIHALKTEPSAQIMAGMLLACILFWNVPMVSWIFFPLKLFVTMIHESCHALACRLTAGNVAGISISPDESGLTYTIGGFRPLVVMAGYMGTAIFGGTLICLGRTPKAARSILQGVGWVLLSLTIFYGGGGLFSFLAMLILSAAVLLISKMASEKTCHLLLLSMAVITTIEALLDARILLTASVSLSEGTDAHNMAQLTGIPTTIWALLYTLVSMAILFFSFWLSYRPSKETLQGRDLNDKDVVSENDVIEEDSEQE